MIFGLTEIIQMGSQTSTNLNSKRKATPRTISLKKTDLSKTGISDGMEKVLFEESISSKKRKLGDQLNIGTNVSRKTAQGKTEIFIEKLKPEDWVSQRSPIELDAAAIKVQKVYKSYRTRRNLADCAVVVGELWFVQLHVQFYCIMRKNIFVLIRSSFNCYRWQALDFAALRRSSVSFFESIKSETAVSRWARARTRAAKVISSIHFACSESY